MVDYGTLYIDMDGVLCNFKGHYRRYVESGWCNDTFRDLVIRGKIFELLDETEEFSSLMYYIKNLSGIKKEILSSTSAYIDDELHHHATIQKKAWLASHGVHYKLNTVRQCLHKGMLFANNTSVLIDDRPEVLDEFAKFGGKVVHHTGLVINSILELDAQIDAIKTITSTN